MPALPASVKEGSQISISGFVKSTVSEKYGLQYSLTATAIIELSETGRSKTITTEPGEPVDLPPVTK